MSKKLSRDKFNQILTDVAREHCLPAYDIMGKSRITKVVKARWDLAMRLRGNGEHSYAEIGRVMGCDHTSILYMCNENYRERRKCG